MRTTPQLQEAVNAFADAVADVGFPDEAAHLLKADTWQMAFCCVEDVAGSVAAMASACFRKMDADGSHTANDLLVTDARRLKYISWAGNWLKDGLRTANVGNRYLANIYARETMKLIALASAT